MKNKNQNGFAVVESLLLLVVAGLIALTGWYVWHAKQSTDKNLSVSNATSPVFKKKQAVTNSVQPQTVVPQQSSPTGTSTPSSTSSTSTSSSQSQPQTQTPSSNATVTELYNISADGTSATEAPVTTTVKATSVTLVVNLTCASACQFKLVSDTATLTNAATYTGSQKITYTLSTPGKYILYNYYTPNTKFGIAF